MEIKIDSVGRLDIPKKIRDLLHWQGGDRLKLTVLETDCSVMLRKVERKCVLCGKEAVVVLLKEGNDLCEECVKKLFLEKE